MIFNKLQILQIAQNFRCALRINDTDDLTIN